jgi:hypothetical protein
MKKIILNFLECILPSPTKHNTTYKAVVQVKENKSYACIWQKSGAIEE